MVGLSTLSVRETYQPSTTKSLLKVVLRKSIASLYFHLYM